MFTIDKVIKLLREAVRFQPRPVSCVTEANDFCSGPLFDKIQRKWKPKLPTGIDAFTFFSCEVDNLTGNEILRLMIDIFNDEKLRKTGNSVLFSSNNEHFFAVMMIDDNYLISTGPRPSKSEDRGIFSFVFDDSYIPHRERNHIPVDMTVMKQRREETIKGLDSFLHDNINRTEEPFKCVYMGMTMDIAFTEIKLKDGNHEEVIRDVPVAACIKLAADSDQIGKLQKVFGEHALDVPDWIESFKRQTMIEENRMPTSEEKDRHISDAKLQRRMKAAEDIIRNAIKPTEMNLFLKEDVDEKVIEIRQLFSIQ